MSATWKSCLWAITALGCTARLSGDAGGMNGPVTPMPGSTSATQPPAGDPGRVAIHRLNNSEYDNTVRDLLGTSATPAASFLAEEGLHFDNTATALGMTTAQLSGYFQAASDLLDEALAKPELRARFLTCVPASSSDTCARGIIQSFGKLMYRRPLAADEVERAFQVFAADFARVNDGTRAVGQALRAMLASPSFLYRVELDADPRSSAPHALSAYEVASRLSYLHYGSMPDAQLFAEADSGALLEPQTLEATVDRLLADPKAYGFVESFAGQWLDVRKLYVHSTVPQIFPTYTPALADAMISETYLWFQEFLQRDRPLSDWFTADFNYVNGVLAQHYGFAAPQSPEQFAQVQVTSDQRQGFLGLASFLTQTSVPSRTSPTARGAWVLSELLCSPPPPPPPDVPKLDEGADPTKMEAVGALNVRERLEQHRQQGSTCAGCHSTFDPIGLGLERYDGIGRYREAYPNGDAIDPQGQMPDGTSFAGPQALGVLIGKDPRFSACVESQLYTYALGREVEDFDGASLQAVHDKWQARGLTLRNLMKEVVLSSAFRFRRGEPE